MMSQTFSSSLTNGGHVVYTIGLVYILYVYLAPIKLISRIDADWSTNKIVTGKKYIFYKNSTIQTDFSGFFCKANSGVLSLHLSDSLVQYPHWLITCDSYSSVPPGRWCWSSPVCPPVSSECRSSAAYHLITHTACSRPATPPKGKISSLLRGLRLSPWRSTIRTPWPPLADSSTFSLGEECGPRHHFIRHFVIRGRGEPS